MRVIAGKFRSRRLQAPAGMETRPTSDRLRETLFNVLDAGGRVAGKRFADLYAGSGAVAIEALSRGAREVWAAENAPEALKAIRANAAALGIAAELKVEMRGVKPLLKKQGGFDVIFLDPPYESVVEYSMTLEFLGRHAETLAPGGIVVAEHSRKNSLLENYGCLRRTRVLLQGDAALSFYSAEELS